MLFHNKAGQSMNLIDNLTIKELLAMGIELNLSEKIDPDSKFKSMNIDESLTLKQLVEMDVELMLSEKIDPEHELWLSSESEDKLE